MSSTDKRKIVDRPAGIEPRILSCNPINTYYAPAFFTGYRSLEVFDLKRIETTITEVIRNFIKRT